MSKEVIALILAGGQGSRLGSLTKKLAKPAVAFGGKYRIIDFTLSNCANSDIEIVGVLTQFESLVLNSYVGIGAPWGLDRRDGGVTILPPYLNEKGGEWYKGTANAVYQNIEFIDIHKPKYVLILSGDHIYKMDYTKLIEFHETNDADATIAVLEVPISEANRFGIMNTNKNGEIYEFEEKPEKPKSNLASMGIYLFNWDILRKFLIKDERDKKSSNDFGKNVIPDMLASGVRLMAYPFKGYWKDVGTIESLWEANMDLLKKDELNLFDTNWRIYSSAFTQPPQYIGESAEIINSLIGEGCKIYGTVTNSVIFPGVYIAKGAVVKDTVVMENTRVSENAALNRSIIGNRCEIKTGCIVGKAYSAAITIVPDDYFMEGGTVYE